MATNAQPSFAPIVLDFFYNYLLVFHVCYADLHILMFFLLSKDAILMGRFIYVVKAMFFGILGELFCFPICGFDKNSKSKKWFLQYCHCTNIVVVLARKVDKKAT